MATVTSMSPSNTNLSQTLSFEKRNSLRDPSFSSYLSNAEENFVLKLTESTQKVSPPTMTLHGQGQGHHIYLGLLKDKEDGEIGVFSAEKYFQGEMEEESTRKLDNGFSTRHLHEKDSSQVKSTQSSPNYLVSTNICHMKEKKQLGTLSVRSESSVNSRSVLLHKIPRNQARGKINKGRHVKSFLTSLGCNCNDKASVEIDELSVENRREEMTKPPLTTVDLVRKAKSMSSSTWAEEEIHSNLKREACFSFPVLNSKPGILAVKSQLQEGEKEKNHLSFQRKLSMLGNWDVLIPREEEIETLSNRMYNDAESDASSDLFEIETNGNSVLARQASDGMSSCMTPATCYAPSEASIEWSVVTASAADCSIFSDYEEGVTGKTKNLDRMVRNAKIGKAGKDMQKRRPGILSGCTSHKAVRVVGNEYKTTGEKAIGYAQGRNELGPITPVTRFRAETKLTGSDFASGHRAFNTCSLPHSHSPHISYIQ